MHYKILHPSWTAGWNWVRQARDPGEDASLAFEEVPDSRVHPAGRRPAGQVVQRHGRDAMSQKRAFKKAFGDPVPYPA